MMDAATLTHALRRDLITGELAVGQIVSESEISAKFGVSKTPVAEALRALAWSGWVEILPRQGYRVTAVRIAEAWESLALLEQLLNARRDQGRWRVVSGADLRCPSQLWQALGVDAESTTSWLDSAQAHVCDRLERVVHLLSGGGTTVPADVVTAAAALCEEGAPDAATIAQVCLRLRRWIQDLLMQSDTPFTR